MDNSKSAHLKLVQQLCDRVQDKALHGRLLADLGDILEVCRWYVKVVQDSSKRPMTQEALEDFLANFQVQILWHLPYHQKSLNRYIHKVADAVYLDQSDNKAKRSEGSDAKAEPRKRLSRASKVKGAKPR